MARPKKYIICLTEEERIKFVSVTKKKKTSITLMRRCKIMLDLDVNSGSTLTHEQIAHSYGVCIATISNIILNYVQNGIDGVIKNKRNPNSNAKRKADGRAEAIIIKIACGPAPVGRSRWTLRLLEKEARLELETPISRETIRRTLKKTNLDLI